MPKGRPARYRTINGILHKECRGPAHPEGEFVPVSEFYKYNVAPRGRPGMLGKPRTWCKWCETKHKGCYPYVPVSRIKFVLIELQSRLGKLETCRRLGRSQNWLWQVNHGRITRLKRETAIRAIVALREARERNEVRHKKSIHHGAYLRKGDKAGHRGIERTVTNYKANEYYFKPNNGDDHDGVGTFGRFAITGEPDS